MNGCLALHSLGFWTDSRCFGIAICHTERKNAIPRQRFFRREAMQFIMMHQTLRQWSWLFSNKNADVIRRIKDRRCRTERGPSWTRSHTAAACHEAFGRQRSYFGGWRQDEQITGGLMLFVAVVAFLIKVDLHQRLIIKPR